MTTLQWTEPKPGLWRTADGQYAIVRTTLPEDRAHPTVTYTLRKIDPAMAQAYPDSLGYFVEERYRLEEVQQAAETNAYATEHHSERSVPETYPALRLAHFYWPVSDGLTRGALAITRDGERLTASVVGMSRHVDAFEPGIYAQIDLTDLVDTDTAPSPTRQCPADGNDALNAYDPDAPIRPIPGEPEGSQGTHFYFMSARYPSGAPIEWFGHITPLPGSTRLDVYRDQRAQMERKLGPGLHAVSYSLEPNTPGPADNAN